MKRLVLPSFALVVWLNSSLSLAAADLVIFRNLHGHTVCDAGTALIEHTVEQKHATLNRLAETNKALSPAQIQLKTTISNTVSSRYLLFRQRAAQ